MREHTESRPIAIDCFAGAGGLSLGLSQAGFDVRAAFDSDPLAVQTYRRNLGDHAVNSRVEDLKGSDLLELAGIPPGACSLVAGGPPCQGFSVQRRGHAIDTRNDLVFEYLRLVLDIRPDVFLMENVSAIAGPRGLPYLKEVKARAESAGYDVTWSVLNAADFGVSQNRRRLFLVGGFPAVMKNFAFPKATHANRYRTVRDAIGDLPMPSVNASGRPPIPNHEPDRISDLNRLRISHVPQGGGREHIPESLRLPCHEVSVDRAGHRNVYGRLHWDEPSGTITTKCNSFTRGKFAHPAENRNITMREAARLQSFPDTFVFEGSKVPVAHQVGNAVPPLLAEQIGRAIIKALESADQVSTVEGPNQFRLHL